MGIYPGDRAAVGLAADRQHFLGAVPEVQKTSGAYVVFALAGAGFP